MNKQVHEYIVKKGFELLPSEIKKNWVKGKESMLATCMYPDIYADRNKIKNNKLIKYLGPNPPKASWYRKILKEIKENTAVSVSDVVVERDIYLYIYHLKKIINHLKKNEYKESGKFAGVFSHIIGDTFQPIHLLNPSVIDLILGVPEKFLSFELHSGIEGISAFPKIKNYSPQLLGSSLPRAIMGFYRKIKILSDKARYTTIPMVEAVYSENLKKAKELAGISVEFAVKVFADFLFTSWNLSQNKKIKPWPLDLTEYPHLSSLVDMLYRYRPLKNISLIPYSGGKHYPLSLREKNGKILKVNGFGVIPYLGPKKTAIQKIKEREAKIEFFIWPESYSFFKSKAGLNPLFNESKGKVVFRIFADDKLIFKSGYFSPKDNAIEIKVKLPEKIHFLTLSMLTVKEPPAPLAKTHPHGVWAYPVLE